MQNYQVVSNALAATIIRIACGTETAECAPSAVEATANELVARNPGKIPSFTYFALVSKNSSPKVNESEIDTSAKTRIDAQQAALVATGVKGVGHKASGGTGEQFYTNGTRMMESGYTAQNERKAHHEKSNPLATEIASLVNTIRAEKRANRTCTAKEFGDSLHVNGKILAFGHSISEQAIRGLCARLESPSLSYLLGLRDRISRESDSAARNADRAKIADIIRHECLRSPDSELQLRTRETPNDIFAIVSPTYVSADAPEVAPMLLENMHRDAKGTHAYNPKTTEWTIRANIWTPTPVAEQAVGEPFSGFAQIHSRDNGTGRLTGGGGIELIRCLNASVYEANTASTSRIHRGSIANDLSKVVANAVKAIDILARVWGENRKMEIEMPFKEGEKNMSIEEALPGFWRSLICNNRSELYAVLPGRKESYLKELSEVTMRERRVTDRLVRSDMAQGFTRFIQNLDDDSRRAGEIAIGDWLASRKPVTYTPADE